MSPFAACYHFQELPSTQTFLLQHPRLRAGAPLFCRANVQTAGTGQRGRHWQSTPGQLQFSLSWPLSGPGPLHAGLTQLTALTIIEALGLDGLHLKWPNDLYDGDQKLMGCLIDLLPREGGTVAVVGIGFNLEPSGAFGGLGARLPVDGDGLLELLLPPLLAAYGAWDERPYLPAPQRWARWDGWHGREARLEDGQLYRLLGIDQKGRLIARRDGRLHYFASNRIALA